MFPLSSLGWEFLSWIGVELCQMLFLCLFRWSHSFKFCVIDVYHIDWFVSIEPSLYPQNKSHLTVVNLMYCWIQFVNTLLRIFASIVTEKWPVGFLFCFCLFVCCSVVSLSDLGVRVMNVFGTFSSSSILWNSLRRISINSSLNVL